MIVSPRLIISCHVPGFELQPDRPPDGRVVPGLATVRRSATGRFLPLITAMLAAMWCGGCATATVGTNQAAWLQQAMDADHKATMGVFKRANQEMLPYRIEQGVAGTTFSKENLFLLSPSDLAAWDDILGGLDAYCAALADLTSGGSSAEFATTAKSLGLKIGSLVRSVHGSNAPSIGGAGTTVGELGNVLIKYKAGIGAQAIAKAADPSFQSVIGSLIDALGFAGHPPAPMPHGLVEACEVSYQTMNAEKIARRFKGDAIAGFDAMTPAERRAAIKDFVAWLDIEQNHQELVASMTALAAALEKAATAHAALAQGSSETIGATFAGLRADIQNMVQISRNYKGG